MARRRDYAAEARRRNELAGERGFASYWQQRRAPRRLSGPGDFALLPESARESRSKALSVIGHARAERKTAEEAAAELKVSMTTARYWAGEALEPQRRGRTLPTRGDRLTRLRPIVLEGQSEASFVVVRGSRAAERADAIFAVQWGYGTGQVDALELDSIRGLRVAGKTVEADPDRLLRLAQAGAIDLPEAYREIVG
jgi:hypothetical protein